MMGCSRGLWGTNCAPIVPAIDTGVREEVRVDRLKQYLKDLEQKTGREFPAFSDEDAGENARILILEQDPGRSTAEKTRRVARSNKGRTANTIDRVGRELGIDWSEVLFWNAVPYYPPKGANLKILARESVSYHDELLKILGNLRVVVLLGDVAHVLTPHIMRTHPDLFVIHGPHPSLRPSGRFKSKDEIEGVREQRYEWLKAAIKKAHDFIEDIEEGR